LSIYYMFFCVECQATYDRFSPFLLSLALTFKDVRYIMNAKKARKEVLIMEPTLKNFRIFPSVIESNKESTLQIVSNDANFLFFDDLTYKIEVHPMEENDVPYGDRLHLLSYYDQHRKTYEVKPQNGVISFSYFFQGEQEWRIHIFCEEYEKHQNPLYQYQEHCWDWLVNAPKNGVVLSVYSVGADLLSRNVLRGDFHSHTAQSDGSESPEMTAAGYRMAGYDVLAITDHYLYNTARLVTDKLNITTDFQVLTAEEVHNGYIGQFHMVNITSQYSINDIYINEPERVEREVQALAEEITVPEGLPQKEYLHRVWLYRAIKKAGGFAIYPHPNWQVKHHYHTETKMSKAILENGLCDAFEVLGGCSPEQRNLQIMLHHTLSTEGTKIPLVGSTDAHSVLSGSLFCSASTILFADSDKLTDAIRDGYSVAVETEQGENPFVYGDYRLVKYVHFLLRNYFPIHDELCRTSGEVMMEYVCGNLELKQTVEVLEKRVHDFGEKFFGKQAKN